ncbi:MAG: right-handed parallel beta-helix repeat-containing protein, partial [Verrucomicrobia bacterium]|nr:right-handed parallel beta-helix repeat-containing protein [Verrucomicrobiota bacterium]
MATQGRWWIGGLAAGWILAAGCSANGPGEAARGPAADFFVATNGNDAWSGRLAAPDAAGSDGPLATLEGARDRLRQVRAGGGPATAATVMVRGGTYVFDRAVEFGAQDSGAEGAPVAYVAEPGASVRFSGGHEVTGWRPVTDAAMLARLPEASRGWAAVADLRAQGLTNWGEIPVRGFGPKGGLAEAELYFDDAPMRLARWPDAGFRGIVDATNATAVVADTDRMARWAGESDPWIFAYWHHDWAELYEPLTGVDPERRALLRRPDIRPVYGITPGRARWYAFNLLSELDRPGEYHLDRQAGFLFLIPPNPDGRIVLSAADSILRADGLSHATFHGFAIEACRGTAVSIKGGTNCTVSGCTIRNTGGRGVHVSGGARHTVFGCDVSGTGDGGIAMSGGDRKTLTPAGHNVENNHVHHFGRRARTYQPGIAVDGVGNRIAHNLVHDGPHMALAAGGNDHLVEFNEIHNVVEESGDAGAYYVGRDWTARGNVLRFNYWHQILGETGYGGMTVYLDDQHSGHTIHGNVFERCMQSIFIGGGDDNVVTNNVFLD